VDTRDRVDGSSRPLKQVQVGFEGRVLGGTLTREVDGTTDEARWIPLADVPDLRRVGLVDAALGMRERVLAGPA
jgi:8-oxo-dGTP diphosphatase